MIVLCDYRRWVQAVFRVKGTNCLSNTQIETKVDLHSKDSPKPETEKNTLKELENGLEIDLSEGMAADMFGISPSTDEVTNYFLLIYICVCVCISHCNLFH